MEGRRGGTYNCIVCDSNKMLRGPSVSDGNYNDTLTGWTGLVVGLVWIRLQGICRIVVQWWAGGGGGCGGADTFRLATAARTVVHGRVQDAQLAGLAFLLGLLPSEGDLFVTQIFSFKKWVSAGSIPQMRCVESSNLCRHNPLPFRDQRTFGTNAVSPAAIPLVALKCTHLWVEREALRIVTIGVF